MVRSKVSVSTRYAVHPHLLAQRVPGRVNRPHLIVLYLWPPLKPVILTPAVLCGGAAMPEARETSHSRLAPHPPCRRAPAAAQRGQQGEDAGCPGRIAAGDAPPDAPLPQANSAIMTCPRHVPRCCHITLPHHTRRVCCNLSNHNVLLWHDMSCACCRSGTTRLQAPTSSSSRCGRPSCWARALEADG